MTLIARHKQFRQAGGNQIIPQRLEVRKRAWAKAVSLPRHSHQFVEDFEIGASQVVDHFDVMLFECQLDIAPHLRLERRQELGFAAACQVKLHHAARLNAAKALHVGGGRWREAVPGEHLSHLGALDRHGGINRQKSSFVFSSAHTNGLKQSDKRRLIAPIVEKRAAGGVVEAADQRDFTAQNQAAAGQCIAPEKTKAEGSPVCAFDSPPFPCLQNISLGNLPDKCIPGGMVPFTRKFTHGKWRRGSRRRRKSHRKVWHTLRGMSTALPPLDLRPHNGQEVFQHR